MVTCGTSPTRTHMGQSASGWHPPRSKKAHECASQCLHGSTCDLQHAVANVHGLIEVVLRDMIPDLLTPRLTISAFFIGSFSSPSPFWAFATWRTLDMSSTSVSSNESVPTGISVKLGMTSNTGMASLLLRPSSARFGSAENSWSCCD